MTVAARKTTDFVARAREGWGEAPDWVLVLAEACATSTQAAVAKQLGYSASAISATLVNSYRGDVGEIAERVRGLLMAAEVECPRKGRMNRNTCLQWQAKPFAPTSSDRVAMFRACRSGCPHSKLKGA